MSLPAVCHTYCDGPYGQTHYRVAKPNHAADLPPLPCLHQTPKSGMDYEKIMPLLTSTSGGRMVIALDTPRYGGSGSPPKPIGIRDLENVMAHFLETICADGVIREGPNDVMGYHTGSVTATELAVTFPRLIRRVVLISLAAYENEERARHIANIERFPPRGPTQAMSWNCGT